MPEHVPGPQPVIPGGLQRGGAFEPVWDTGKNTGPNSEADPEFTPAWAKSPMQIEGYLFRGHGFRLIGIAIGIGFDSQNISIPMPIAIAMVKIHADDTCDRPVLLPDQCRRPPQSS